MILFKMSSTGFRGIPPRKKREPAVNISRTAVAASTTNKLSFDNTSKSAVNPESLSGIKSITQPVPHQQVRQQSEGIVAGVAKIAITTTQQPQMTARNPTIRSSAENKVEKIIVPSNGSPGSEYARTGVSGPISISSNTKSPSPAGKSPDQKSNKSVESSPGTTSYLGVSGAAHNHTIPAKVLGRNLETLGKQSIPSSTGDQRKGSPLPNDTETSPRKISGITLAGNQLSTAEVPKSPSRQSLPHESQHVTPSTLPHSLQSASVGSLKDTNRKTTSPITGEDSAIVGTLPLPKSPSGRVLTPMQSIPEASFSNAYLRQPVKPEEPMSLNTLGDLRSASNLLSGNISSTNLKDEYSPHPNIQASNTIRDTDGKSNSTTAPAPLSGQSPLMKRIEPVQNASANEHQNSNEIPHREGVEGQEAPSNGGQQLPHAQYQSNEFQFENQFNEGEVNMEAPSEKLHFNYQEGIQFNDPNAGDQYYQSEKDFYGYNDDGVLDQQHNYSGQHNEQHQENGELGRPLEFQEYQNYGPLANTNGQNFTQQHGFENNSDNYIHDSNPQMYEAHDPTRLQSNFDNEQISYGEENYDNYGGQYYENENGSLQYEDGNGALQYENEYDGQQYKDDFGGQQYQNEDGGQQYENQYNFQQFGIEYNNSQHYENEFDGQLYGNTYDNQQYGNAYDGQQYEHEYNVLQYNGQQRTDQQIDYQSGLYPCEYVEQENYNHDLHFQGYNQHQEYREYSELGQQHLNSEAQLEDYPAGTETIGQEQDYEGLTSVDHGDFNQNDFGTYQLHRDKSKSQTLINGPQSLEMKICYPCNLEYEKHMNFCGACGSHLEVQTPIVQNNYQQPNSSTSPVNPVHNHDAQRHQTTAPTIPGALQRFNCIATFGFNGQLVYTTPIIQTIFQTTNAGVPKPVLKGFPGPIKICKVEKLVDSKILQELNQILKFGPLFSDQKPSQAKIIEILENLKVNSESKDFSNLVEYLIILTKKYSILIFSTPEDLALRSLRDVLAEDSQTDQSTAGILQTHLMKGNLGAACSAAASSGFWLEAMLISKHINSQAMGAVTRDYIQKAMSGAVVSPSLQDYPALAIALAALGGAEPESTIQNCIIDSSSNWNWKSILMILISIKDKIDPQFFKCLACLMSEIVNSSVGSLW